MGIIEKMRLDGKKIFVTGGARGIGKSVSIGFAEAGADVAIVDIDIDEAKKTAAMLKDTYKINSIAIKTDVTNQDDVNSMIDTILQEFGRIDVAFCNAGICINAPAEEIGRAHV